ncbi:hypothetical protein MKK50_15285 [Methylobacterium sp. J-043]|nr:hypothetical protein [Methylobacterium sp. J-043]
MKNGTLDLAPDSRPYIGRHVLHGLVFYIGWESCLAWDSLNPGEFGPTRLRIDPIDTNHDPDEVLEWCQHNDVAVTFLGQDDFPAFHSIFRALAAFDLSDQNVAFHFKMRWC